MHTQTNSRVEGLCVASSGQVLRCFLDSGTVPISSTGEMCMAALKFSRKLRFLLRVDWCTILNTNSTVHKTGSFPNTIFSCLKNSLRRGSTGSSQRLICRSMADIRSSLAPLFTPRVTVRDLQEKKRKMGEESAGDG